MLSITEDAQSITPISNHKEKNIIAWSVAGTRRCWSQINYQNRARYIYSLELKQEKQIEMRNNVQRP